MKKYRRDPGLLCLKDACLPYKDFKKMLTAIYENGRIEDIAISGCEIYDVPEKTTVMQFVGKDWIKGLKAFCGFKIGKSVYIEGNRFTTKKYQRSL